MPNIGRLRLPRSEIEIRSSPLLKRLGVDASGRRINVRLPADAFKSTVESRFPRFHFEVGSPWMLQNPIAGEVDRLTETEQADVATAFQGQSIKDQFSGAFQTAFAGASQYVSAPAPETTPNALLATSAEPDGAAVATTGADSGDISGQAGGGFEVHVFSIHIVVEEPAPLNPMVRDALQDHLRDSHKWLDFLGKHHLPFFRPGLVDGSPIFTEKTLGEAMARRAELSPARASFEGYDAEVAASLLSGLLGTFASFIPHHFLAESSSLERVAFTTVLAGIATVVGTASSALILRSIRTAEENLLLRTGSQIPVLTALASGAALFANWGPVGAVLSSAAVLGMHLWPSYRNRLKKHRRELAFIEAAQATTRTRGSMEYSSIPFFFHENYDEHKKYLDGSFKDILTSAIAEGEAYEHQLQSKLAKVVAMIDNAAFELGETLTHAEELQEAIKVLEDDLNVLTADRDFIPVLIRRTNNIEARRQLIPEYEDKLGVSDRVRSESEMGTFLARMRLERDIDEIYDHINRHSELLGAIATLLQIESVPNP